MDEWVDNLHRQANILHDQIAALRDVAHGNPSEELQGLIESYQGKLEELYESELPVARILDQSDILAHAEGPAARSHAANSGTVAWLCQQVDKQLKGVALTAASTLESIKSDIRSDLKILVTGMAPGSLYAGFSLDSAKRMANPAFEGWFSVDAALQSLKQAVRILPSIPSFIGQEGINPDINEAIDNAALRDAALLAAYYLAPTGRRGIHSLDLSAPGQQSKPGLLTARERIVLRETAVLRPSMGKTQKGEFTGHLLEVDLHYNRFQLRNVHGIGTLRCSMDITAETARRHLGQSVVVRGDYEALPSGRPALIRVSEIQPGPQQYQLE